MNLFSIKESVQEVAEAISAVLKVDVTIIDHDFTRIASTGEYRRLVGKRIPSNCMFENIAKTKKPEYAYKTKDDSTCDNCEYIGECRELATMGYPIIKDNEVIGIIGINAFEEEQKIYIEKNYDNLLTFLNKLSILLVGNLISNGIITELTIKNEETKKIIDNFSYGIICVDRNGAIKNINKKAIEYLNLYSKDLNNISIKDIIPDINIESNDGYIQEKKVSISKKKLSFMIKNNPVIFQGKNVSNIIEVHKTSDAIREAYKLIEGQKIITFEDIIGESDIIKHVKEIAIKVSKGNSTVILRGESGTGKELFARAIHYNSKRRYHPFIAINCASIPDNLLESELFGYEGGAFSGSRREGQMGKFELANSGTLFLDEIGDLPLHLQPKILRALQEQNFMRIGGKELINVDFRLIAATNRDLEKMVQNGEFREDLYYRLNVIPIILPPLKEREEDIIILSEVLLQKYCTKLQTNNKKFAKEVKEVFKKYSWPGNIRELENVIEYMVNVSKLDIITNDSLPETMKKSIYNSCCNDELSMKQMIENYEKEILISMLKKYGDSTENKVKISKKLGMNLSTLYRKLEKYNL